MKREIIVTLWVCGALMGVCFFYGIRNALGGLWNRGLYEIAIKENGPSLWYTNWNYLNAVLNPWHFNKWTTKQWLRYLKKPGE